MEKKLIEYTTTTAIWTKPITEQKEVYIETKTITEATQTQSDILPVYGNEQISPEDIPFNPER